MISRAFFNTNIPIGEETVDKWHPLPLDYEPTDLIAIPVKYCAEGSQNKNMSLREEVLEAVMSMIEKAEADHIIIRIVSAYRSATYQRKLYQRVLKKQQKSLPDTAAPGFSEHQLGTVVDISTPELNFGLAESFSQTKAYQWIIENALVYRFYISYTKENHIGKGYIWEPWHLRYWGKQGEL